MGPATGTRQLSTAEERREALVEAAMGAFADRGYYGTPTLDVAKAAGISQAYLFRLFPTKEELFVGVVERCYERVLTRMRVAAEGARGGDAMAVYNAMGKDAYSELLTDRRVFMIQLHAQAACSEPAVRNAVRRGLEDLVELVRSATGLDEEEIQRFFAIGMLSNTIVAVGAQQLRKPWARTLTHDLVFRK